MNTLSRNASTGHSRSRRVKGNEVHQRNDHDHDHQHQHQHQKLVWSFSKRMKLDYSRSRIRSRSYRNDRAKQRRIFLNSFKLETSESLGRRRRPKSRKLKKLNDKVSKAVDSVLSFMRIDSGRLRNCFCRLAIGVSNPTQVLKK